MLSLELALLALILASVWLLCRVQDRRRNSLRDRRGTLNLLHTLIETLAGAEGLEAAEGKILQAFADHYQWDAGAIWLVEPDGTLRCERFWHQPGLNLTSFRDLTCQLRIQKGQEPVGKAWKDLELQVKRVSKQNLPSRIKEAGSLKGIVAFPLVSRGEVSGVIEFFTANPKPIDVHTEQMLKSVGSQLGQFIAHQRAQEEVRQSELEKTDILNSASEAIVSIDLEGKIHEWNSAAERIFGLPKLEALQKPLFPGFIKSGEDTIATLLRQTQLLKMLDSPLELMAQRKDGTVFPVELNVGKGAMGFISLFIRDISEEKKIQAEQIQLLTQTQAAKLRAEKAERRFRFLAQSGKLLESSLNYQETLNHVLRLPVPQLASWTALYLVNGRRIEFVGAYHPDTELTRVIARQVREYDTSLRSANPLSQAANKGKVIIDRNFAGAAELSVPSKMGAWVPLRNRNQIIGVMLMALEDEDPIEEDLSTAEELAGRSAVAIESAKLYQEQVNIARNLQNSIIPPELPAAPGLECASGYRPAGHGKEVGGDFFDFFELPSGEWLAMIGDVCGKGSSAAAATALARYTIRAAALKEHRPQKLLEVLNQASLSQLAEGRFYTVGIAKFCPYLGGAKVDLCLAGHPAPLVLSSSGQVYPLEAEGNLIGVFPEIEAKPVRVSLKAGDSLILYTDGLTDARGEEGFLGEAKLQSLLAGKQELSAKELANYLEAAILNYQKGKAADDLAFMVIRIPEVQVFNLHHKLPAELESVKAARHLLAKLKVSLPELPWKTIELLVSELTTNAVCHGNLPINQQWITLDFKCDHASLKVAVTNPGSCGKLCAKEQAPDRSGGRGLWLIETLASRWGSESAQDQTTVWFELDLNSSQSDLPQLPVDTH